MHKFIERIRKKAKASPKRIVLPESEDSRIQKAAKILAKKGFAKPILVGRNKIHIKGVEFVQVGKKDYSKQLYNLRKKKNLTLEQAKKLLEEPIYYSTMMVQQGDADGLVSGAVHPTAHTLKPALQILKDKLASSFMIMLTDKVYFFADCGFNIFPNHKELAKIAINTAKSAKSLGFEPKIAMLSFSTKGSAKHVLVDKVKKATDIVKKKGYVVDGEIQLDAAIVQKVAELKNPKGTIKGDANILIFPDLNAGNIGYKLVQRFANARAIGPVIQGLKKPINDLSRGCSVEDIVDLCALTSLQAK